MTPALPPAALVPVPDPIPGPWGWFQALLLLTFVVHLLFMNVVLGTGVITLFRSMRTPFAPNDQINTDIRETAAWVPRAMALAVNFGVPPLLFLQVLYGQFIYPSSILMATWWLGIVGFVMMAYYGFYLYGLGHAVLGPRRTLVAGISVALLLVNAFVLTNNATLMLDPTRWTGYAASPGGTLLNWGEPSLVPRYLHMVMGAVAVGGLFIAGRAKLLQKAGGPVASGPLGPQDWELRITEGLKWFTHATYAQFVLGTWFLFSLPGHLTKLFMGGHGLATGAFALGLAGTVLALVAARQRRVWLAAGAATGVIFLMAAMRAVLRDAWLAPHLDASMAKAAAIAVVPPQLPMTGQEGAAALFVVSLVAGIVAIWWLVVIARRSGKEA
ncbi:MAG TPA: peptidase [Nitratidesulfovibrio sp.]|nr:peptidase [Nitratidesulfovibrio sp.]